ncbi:hypothetical protein QWA68_015086 [Fusarium oxysporum]|nr:hypothetical protein QWA68_015086 [Fusarium oxysporum]
MSSSACPHLEKTAVGTRLVVNDKPFLMLAGELNNSSASSSRYMSRIWPEAGNNGINTLLAGVSWEMIEPVEDNFDFSELDKVITGAREHSMHLVILWFGSFKNGLSTYAPAWVKKNLDRFPRVQILKEDQTRQTIEMLSPFSEAAVKADAKAFSKLMDHIKHVDAGFSTVVMVQVENETGVLGDSRDRSPLAEAAFKDPVPDTLLEHLRSITCHPQFAKRFGLPRDTKNSWTSIFGNQMAADEAFMAYHISSYVGKVAAAGKAVHAIPLYTNAWLNADDTSTLDLQGMLLKTGAKSIPGVYPSGGPVAHMMDIWRFNAPSLDFVSPDIYFHDYESMCQDYTRQGNLLFIPEQRKDAYGCRRIWLAYGTYDALGTSPFGVDTGVDHVGREYRLLSKVKNDVLRTSIDQRFGFFFDDESGDLSKKSWVKEFGDIKVIVERAFVFGRPGPGAGMVIYRGNNKFLLVGYGFQVRFEAVAKNVSFVGILHAEEKEVDDAGNLTTLRVFNGDETRGGESMVMPNENPDYGSFPIAVSVPANTGIAEVEAYVID